MHNPAIAKAKMAHAGAFNSAAVAEATLAVITPETHVFHPNNPNNSNKSMPVYQSEIRRHTHLSKFHIIKQDIAMLWWCQV